MEYTNIDKLFGDGSGASETPKPQPLVGASGERKVVINTCFGGFGLSDMAYEKLIEWGVPVKEYVSPERDPETGRYKTEPLEKVIYDRELTPRGTDSLSDIYWKYKGTRTNSRYWEVWLDDERENPLLIKVVKELGNKANGFAAKLKVVTVPENIEYEISEYDGLEHIAETHRTWS